MPEQDPIVVVGAGIGGLSAALELARSGRAVTVLEAHVEPGGCAGTFYHQGYRFDAGATLAGGFAPGAPMARLGQHFGIDWQARPAQRAMQVHLPDGSQITRWSDADRWQAERLHWFGEGAEPFWQWQESTADALWDFALRLPAWPPQSARQWNALVRSGLNWQMERRSRAGQLVDLSRAAFQALEAHLPANPRLRAYIDGQLMISAQATSERANALYGSAALDLARQGVVHLTGGMGSLAHQLVSALRREGGQVLYRQAVTRVLPRRKNGYRIETKRGLQLEAGQVIFNLPPWNLKNLLGEAAPRRIQRLPAQPQAGWGAFMLYIGLDERALPAEVPLHQQVIAGQPLGEGNSIFLSLSPAWDQSRAPQGKRALTISTHTRLEPWWQAFADPAAYQARKAAYVAKVLATAERAIPGLTAAAELLLPGTPVTFQRFTRRAFGWVGGFPQTNLFRSWGPRLSQDLWLVGDSIFPGQSVPAVALGGLRVAQLVLERPAPVPGYQTTGNPLRNYPIRN